MKARRYDKRIRVYETTPVPNGSGGDRMESVLIANSWAEIVTEGVARKFHNMGIMDFNDPLIFKVRHRNDLPYNARTLYVTYKGNRYNIQGIKNLNLRDVDIEIYTTLTQPEDIATIGVLNVEFTMLTLSADGNTYLRVSPQSEDILIGTDE